MVSSRDGKKDSNRASEWSDIVLTIQEGPEPGKQFFVDRQSFTIGSAPGNDVVIPHPDVARYHAVVVWEENHWVIHSLDTSGGTFVNGRKAEGGQPVWEGDTIGLGNAVALACSGHSTSKSDEAIAREHDGREPCLGAISTSVEIDAASEPSQSKQSMGWLLAALLVLLGVTALLVLMVVVVLSRPGDDSGAAALVVTQPPDMSQTNDSALLAETTTPTAIPTATPIPLPSRTATPVPPPTPTPTPCVDNTVFVADVTLPDGSVVSAGERINKTWRLRNTGTCTWREGYRFTFVSGDAMGVVNSVLVAYTDPGMLTDVAVPMFAPKVLGEHSSSWQMVNGHGEAFGKPVSVELLVRPAPTAIPSSPDGDDSSFGESTAETAIHFWIDDEILQAGEKTALHVVTEDVAAVWLDGDIVIGGRETREVSPCSTTNYTLDVQLRDGNHVYHDVVVDVIGSCPDQENPDLSVDYSVHPIQLIAGQPAVISYTVLNRGEDGANVFDVVFGPGITSSQRITVRSDLNLASAYGLKSSYSYTWPISGVFQTTLWVDRANLVEESDEDNNAATHVVVVSGD
jgi:hypothetical protein